jgi:hypothetical protein
MPETITERNRLGQTPLHLAADWPWGTSQLLAAGAPVDVSDENGAYPVNYASKVECWTTFEILLASDSPILGSGLRSFYNDFGLFGLNCISLPPQTFDHICIALVDRRKRLVRLAMRILTAAEYADLVSSNPGIIDSKAREVYNIIASRGCQIQSALCVPSTSSTVYHTRYLKPKEMSKLYNAGFREVDTPNSSGETPFMAAAYAMGETKSFRACEWLISKGTDPLRKVSGFGTVQIHYVAARMKETVVWKLEDWHEDSEEACLSRAAFTDLEYGVRFITRESSLPIRDQCQCACSTDGCSPLHLLLKLTLTDICKRIIYGWCTCRKFKRQQRAFPEKKGIPEECVQSYGDMLYYFAKWALEVAYEHQDIPNSAYLEAIRLFVFFELELTHTCCELGIWNRIEQPKSLGEVHEIQEEERELLLELETLCAEGNARRALYDGPFNEFLRDFLVEVRERPQARLTKEEIRKIEEIGVVLEQDIEE